MPAAKTLVCCRWVLERDIPRIIEISKGTHHPFSQTDFRETCRGDTIALVAEDDWYGVLGFVVYDMRHRRLHLRYLAVDQQHQRKKIATQLIATMVRRLSESRRTRITAEVPESRLDVQLFLRSAGFRATCVLRDGMRYDDGGIEDAYRMEYRLLKSRNA